MSDLPVRGLWRNEPAGGWSEWVADWLQVPTTRRQRQLIDSLVRGGTLELKPPRDGHQVIMSIGPHAGSRPGAVILDEPLSRLWWMDADPYELNDDGIAWFTVAQIASALARLNRRT